MVCCELYGTAEWNKMRHETNFANIFDFVLINKEISSL